MAKNTKKFLCKCIKIKTSIAKIMHTSFKFHTEMLIVLSSVIYINDFSFQEMNRKKIQKLVIGAQVQIKDVSVTCVTII